MVRPNRDETSKGFDSDKGVQANQELEKEGKSTFETQFPDGEPNKQPIDIRGDAEPDLKG